MHISISTNIKLEHLIIWVQQKSVTNKIKILTQQNRNLQDYWNNKPFGVTNLREQIILDVQPYMFQPLGAILRGMTV
jgi:hypothetical protein